MAEIAGFDGRLSMKDGLKQSLRIAVTGRKGQLVSALAERAGPYAAIIPVGRPVCDLADRESVLSALRATRCDAIINAAAYTAVDKAESEPELALRINGEGAGHVAASAAELNVPLLHISTDYVFDGALGRPYRESDAVNPTSVYGLSKLTGERNVMRLHANSVILRAAWIYSPFGANFMKTMLRLGETRAEVGVVADQCGNPTSAFDLADALLTIARRLSKNAEPALRGVFHMSAAGEASWADFAEAIFAEAARHGRPPVGVKRISTTDYPTPARRPANSRLDNSKLSRIHALALPDWRISAAACVARLIASQE